MRDIADVAVCVAFLAMGAWLVQHTLRGDKNEDANVQDESDAAQYESEDAEESREEEEESRKNENAEECNGADAESADAESADAESAGAESADAERVDTDAESDASVGTESDDDQFVRVRHYEPSPCLLPTTHLTADDLRYDKHIVRVDADTSVATVLDAMHAAQATCALVQGTQEHHPLGVVEATDVVRHVLRGAPVAVARRLLTHCAVARGALPLPELCRHLCHGTRHVVVRTAAGSARLVSQRLVAKVVVDLAACDARLAHALESTSVRDARLPSFGRVVAVPDTAPARAAFELMVAYGITSLPVLDAAGRATCVVSATDVLHARHDAALVHLDVRTYVARCRAAGGPARPAVVACRPADALSDAVRAMLDHAVHHVYVLDAAERAVGVVSFVDVLRVLVDGR